MVTVVPRTFRNLVRHIPKILHGKVDALVLLGFLSLSLFSLRSIFATSDPVAFQDLAPMYRLDQLFRPYDFPWDYKSNLGSPIMLTGNAVYNLPLIGLSLAFGSVTLAHKVLLVILMGFAGFGFYLAFTYLVGSKTAGFTASLYSIFNPFTLVRWVYGHNTILLAYMILSFALLSYFKVMRNGGGKSIVTCGLLLALLIAASPHIAYLFVVFMLLYIGFDLVFLKRTDVVKRIKLRSIQLSLLLGVALVATLPFLYQVMMVNLPVYSVRAEEAVLVIFPTDVDVLMLPSVALVAFVISAFLYLYKSMHNSILSLIKEHRWRCLFFIMLGLLSMLLVSLAVEPLTWIYQWLFNNVPGFSMFREVNKFFLLSVLSVAFFLGLLTEGFKRCLVWGSSITRNTLPLLLISLIVLAPSWQFLTGDVGGKVGTVEIPEEYKELENWLTSEEGDFRIAFFPPAVWATTYSWAPRWFLDPLVALQVKPTVELKSEFDVTPSSSFTRWVYTALYSNRTSEWGRLLGILGVKYVILRLDADMRNYRRDLSGFSLANTLAAWENQRDLSFERRLGSILIFRNPHQLPHIYQAEGFSLVVGDRKMIVSLNHLGFDFHRGPAVFLDDNIGSAEFLAGDARYVFFQGDPYWSLLTSSLGETFIVRPWIYAPLSANPTDNWVRGDLIWYRFNGSLNVAPDGYIYTEGANTITIPLNVEKPGNYRILAQVFDGLPGSIGIRFTMDHALDFIFTTTRYSEGSYVWVEVGRLTLNNRSMVRISSLGGPAAVSKVALVPEEAIDEAERNISKKLQRSAVPMVYVFDDYSWSYDSEALIIDPKASNGRLIALLKSSVEAGFHVFRDDAYTLRLKFQASDEDAIVRVYVSKHVESVKVGRGVEGFSTEVDIGPLELKSGYHNIRIEAEKGDARLDMAVMSTRIGGVETLSNSHTDSGWLSYRMCSSSEYVVDGLESYLVFLEGGSSHWRLYGRGDEHIPLSVFGYASLFHLSEPESQCILRYLGLTHLKQGILMALAAIALVALGLRFLGSKRFTLLVSGH